MNASARAAIRRCEQRVRDALNWYDRFPVSRPQPKHKVDNRRPESMFGSHFTGDPQSQEFNRPGSFDPTLKGIPPYRRRFSY